MNTPVLTSLRARMTLGFTAWFVGFALVVCIGFFLWMRLTAREEMEERVRAATHLVALEWDGDPRASSVTKAFHEAHEDMRLDDLSILIVDDSGKVLGANQSKPLPWPSPQRQGWLTAETHDHGATIIAGMNWRAIEGKLRQQTLMLLFCALLTTMAAAAAAWVIVGRTLAPIGALSEQADTASAEVLHTHLSAPSQDAEVRRLVDTLNRLLDRLREHSAAREHFYAAAAHELRTPLAVLSGSVEVALSRPREGAEYRETLTDLQHQTRRLTTLVEDLLMLNRLDMNTGAEETEAVDIATVCERALKALQPLVGERKLHVEAQLDLAGDVLAPPTHVAILVQNFIENAVKYTTTGGNMSVSLSPCPEGIRFQVANDYQDSGDLDLDQIFEPFYRAATSRSSFTDGNGLGLPICQRIAQVNGWKLTIERKAGRVIAVAVFPLAEQEIPFTVLSSPGVDYSSV